MVRAIISPLPVAITDRDVAKLKPNEDEPNDWVVELGDHHDDDHEFPFCCAISVLGGAKVVDGDNYADDPDKITPKHKEALKECLEGELRQRQNTGLILYTLIDSQVTEAEVLLELGFQVMAVFKNPNTTNRITLYGKLVNQPREAKLRKPTKKARR